MYTQQIQTPPHLRQPVSLVGGSVYPSVPGRRRQAGIQLRHQSAGDPAEHLKLHPDIAIHETYIDDGGSGTNFDRPGFLRMMADIYAGKVNCVIVKDLSRFCRNASEGGQYLDNVFIRYRVRFIALTTGSTPHPAI